MKVKARDLFIFLIFLLSYSIVGRGGYYKYLYVLLLTVIFLAQKKFIISPKYFVIFFPAMSYILIGLGNAVLKGTVSFISFKVICFLLIPLIIAVAFCNMVDCGDIIKYVDMQFFSIAFLILIEARGGIDLNNLIEGTFAFICGAYAIFYYCAKRKNMFMAAVILNILTHKRIATFAMILGIYLIWLLVNRKSSQIRVLLLRIIAFATLGGSYLWVAMAKFGLARKIMGMLGINSNGRLDIWDRINSMYTFSPIFFGKGIGYIMGLLKEFQVVNFANLHNDVLMIYIELGFIGLGIFWAMYFYIAYVAGKKYKRGGTREVFIMIFIVYTIINYLTDNILIYISYWMPASLLILSALYDKKWGESDSFATEPSV